MNTLPPGFTQVVAHRGIPSAETETGFSVYRNHGILISRAIRENMPPERFPRLVVAVNADTQELYVGPALNNEPGSFMNPKNGHIGADSVAKQVKATGFDEHSFYRAVRAGNGWVTSIRNKR